MSGREMGVVTGDAYVELLLKYVEREEGELVEGERALKMNPLGLHYVNIRLEKLRELEQLSEGAPVDYLRAYIAELGDYRALEHLRRLLQFIPSLKVVSVLRHPLRDPTPVCLSPFSRLRRLELRGCNLSASAARGLLELAHSLEELVCFNSTEALRHIFAARIVDITCCPVWRRLSFVSCSNNNMLLMDESLQLLPAVVNLQLSQNRFASISNLHKCTQLKHLQLGYNHIRTLSSLSKVSSGIKTLILKNNALTTLHGIENLTALEGLDLSFNLISNFSEIGLLASLPSLERLWLEGNPLSYSKHYREQTFSFFSNPERLVLDGKRMTRKETWTVKIILSRRQRQKPGFGFYAPAKYIDHSKPSDEVCGSSNHQLEGKRKFSRLASINNPENAVHLIGTKPDSSCSSSLVTEIQRTYANDIGEYGSLDVSNIFNKIELLKKEKSDVWFQHLEGFLSPSVRTSSKDSKHIPHNNSKRRKQVTVNKNRKEKKFSDVGSISEEKSCHSRSDEPDASKISGINPDYGFPVFTSTKVHFRTEARESNGDVNSRHETSDDKMKLTSKSDQGCDLRVQESHGNMNLIENYGTVKDTGDMLNGISAPCCSRSPPHYEEDILHRHQNLDYRFMQDFQDSQSMSSFSGSDTSDDDPYLPKCLTFECTKSLPIVTIGKEDPAVQTEPHGGHSRQNKLNSSCLNSAFTSMNAYIKPDSRDGSKFNEFENPLTVEYGETVSRTMFDGITSDFSVTCARKKNESALQLNKDVHLGQRILHPQNEMRPFSFSTRGLRNEIRQNTSTQNMLARSQINNERLMNPDFKMMRPLTNAQNRLQALESHSFETLKDPLLAFFNQHVADCLLNERCLSYVYCQCIRLWEDDPHEREVAVLFSSERKLYILEGIEMLNESGSTFKVLGCHKLDDIKTIIIGLGLQVLRIHIGSAASYLILTRSVDKSREIIGMLENFHSNKVTDACDPLFQSWEILQLELFDKSILGGQKLSIYFYAMVLLEKDGTWFPRSLILTEDYLFLCVEDLIQFGIFSQKMLISEPYIVQDSFSSIKSILELVINSEQEGIFTIVYDACEKLCLPIQVFDSKQEEELQGYVSWRLKGIDEPMVNKFVTLLRSLYMEVSMHALTVKCV